VLGAADGPIDCPLLEPVGCPFDGSVVGSDVPADGFVLGTAVGDLNGARASVDDGVIVGALECL
jgi:hypothetical protein